MGKKATPPASSESSPREHTSVADALFTGTQQRVLALLFGQPGRSFFTKELIELAGSGSGSVQRELGRLQRSGLVTQTIVGNQKHYQANRDAPIFPELCGIVGKLLGTAEVLREVLTSLAEEITLALLYGSVAKRSDTARSDIDLLLVTVDERTLQNTSAALLSEYSSVLMMACSRSSRCTSIS